MKSATVSDTNNSPIGSSSEGTAKTEWGTIWIGAMVCFMMSIEFSIYFSSLWPYLLQLDSTVTEDMYGYVIAVYSVGQAFGSPVFGFLSDRMKQTRVPAFMGMAISAFGNICYILLPTKLLAPQYMMLFARFVTGFGGGIIGVMRNAAVRASTATDRSRAISVNIAALSLGLAIGPALQLLYTPLSYPGISIIGPISLNVYTGAAFTSIVVDIISMFMIVFIYRDSSVGLHKIEEDVENEEHKRFFALPKFDWIAAAVCIFTRFVQMFVFTNMETVGPPMTMIVFNWTKEDAVFYNSMIHSFSAIILLILYTANAVFNISKGINNRIWCIVGILFLAAFHVLTYPYPFLSGKIKYQEEGWINGTEPTGCRRSFEWCANVPAINLYMYVFAWCVVSSFGYVFVTITMNTVYSVVIGPRNQGAMQGLLIFIGSIARLVGPIVVANIFTASGHGIPWIISTVVALVCASFWIIFYDRLVPLRMGKSLSAGDMYRSKHGPVYKL